MLLFSVFCPLGRESWHEPSVKKVSVPFPYGCNSPGSYWCGGVQAEAECLGVAWAVVGTASTVSAVISGLLAGVCFALPLLLCSEAVCAAQCLLPHAVHILSHARCSTCF